MKYRELLELYKQGKLEEEKAQQLAADIERHEAISEYLFDEEVPEVEALLQDGKKAISESSVRIRRVNGNDTENYNTTDLKFARMIHRSIRRAFVKLGVTVIAIVAAGLLFVQFALPEIVDSMYYQPDKVVEGDFPTKQFDLDISVYTEMFVPNQHRMSTMVESDRFGKYDIIVNQSYSINRNFVDVVGKIDKGEITFYNHNVLLPPTGNAFAWSAGGLDPDQALSEQIPAGSDRVHCASGEPEYAKTLIEDLDEKTYYNAFVTLDRIMDYEEFIDFISNTEYKGTGVWCAPVVSEDSYNWSNVGFFYDPPSLSSNNWNNEKYPELTLWCLEIEDRLDMTQEENALTHFTSMLSYLNNQEQFSKMMHLESMDFEGMKTYVEENGLKIYGYLTFADKETMLGLMEEEEVYTIYTTVAR